jgi:hypothetical protein
MTMTMRTLPSRQIEELAARWTTVARLAGSGELRSARVVAEGLRRLPKSGASGPVTQHVERAA